MCFATAACLQGYIYIFHFLFLHEHLWQLLMAPHSPLQTCSMQPVCGREAEIPWDSAVPFLLAQEGDALFKCAM